MRCCNLGSATSACSRWRYLSACLRGAMDKTQWCFAIFIIFACARQVTAGGRLLRVAFVRLLARRETNVRSEFAPAAPGPRAPRPPAHAWMSLINFSSLETVLKNVSEQQKTIAATLERIQEEVATLATGEELSAQERILADG